MPKTNRDYMLRKHDQAMNDLDRCLEKLQWLHEKYSARHPRHASMVQGIASGVIEIQTILERFRQEMM